MSQRMRQMRHLPAEGIETDAAGHVNLRLTMKTLAFLAQRLAAGEDVDLVYTNRHVRVMLR